MMTFDIQLIENGLLIVGPFEDWSQVRSKGRAKRRRAKGHPQRITFFSRPDPNIYKLPNGMMVGHPVTIRALRQAISEPRP